MTDYELFGGKCPYTDKECVLTIECVDCAVDREEKESMERLDKTESEEV